MRVFLKRINISNYNLEILKYCPTFVNIVNSINYLFLNQLLFVFVTVIGLFYFILPNHYHFFLVVPIFLIIIYFKFLKYIITIFQTKLNTDSLILILTFYALLSLLTCFSLFQFIFNEEIKFELIKNMQALNHSFMDLVKYKIIAVIDLFNNPDVNNFYIITVIMLYIFIFFVYSTPYFIMFSQRNSIYYKINTYYERFK